MAKNKYLKAIGVKPYLHPDNWEYHPFSTKKEWKKEEKRFKKQRKTRGGYDQRETWDMDVPFAEWIYTHICMYEEWAGKIIDTSYHTLQAGGKTYTQQEAMDKVKENLEYFLKTQDWPEKNEENRWEKYHEACVIWVELVSFMWW